MSRKRARVHGEQEDSRAALAAQALLTTGRLPQPRPNRALPFRLKVLAYQSRSARHRWVAGDAILHLDPEQLSCRTEHSKELVSWLQDGAVTRYRRLKADA